MKIIKKGRKGKGWRTKCRSCDCVFLFKRDEIVDWGPVGQSVTCPNPDCGVNVVLYGNCELQS